jgi:predicted phage terminase large subunit-like protein
MPKPTDINPKTGRRYDWVDPRKDKDEELRAINAQRVVLLLRQQKILQARENLLPFTQFTMPDPAEPSNIEKSIYTATRMHQEVAKALEAVERGEIRRLIFCMPPRHGKTELATKRLAAWYLGRHPDHQVIVGTYNDVLANRFGGETRAILQSPHFKQVFPDCRLRRGGESKTELETVAGGRLIFAGRGTGITGSGAHILLLDDLYKDGAEARSQAIRDQAWEWFTRAAMTRLMGMKLVVITMTRWHSDDVIGRLTDPENPCYNEIEAKKWKIIRLPAIAEDDDPLGRAPGEALWPEVHSLDDLLSFQRTDPLGFAALYQQRPTVADGVLFRRETIQFYTPENLPKDLRIYCASDHAVATGQRNDYTALIKVGVDAQNNIYVLDCDWRRITSEQAVTAMLTMATDGQKPLIWWAEKGHISKSIGPFLYKRMEETGNYFTVREVTPVGDKEQRAQSIAARVAMGKVYFPKNAVWTERAINEMLAFPNGTHDDFVDALSYIGLGLQYQYRADTPTQKKAEPRFGTLAWVKQQDEWHAKRTAEKSLGGF